MAALPGIITSPEIRYLLAGVLILTGLALAFWGHGLWATVMSMIGALLGAVVGYLFGAALGGDLAGLILAIVRAVIGSILFTKLVNGPLAFLVGLLAGAGRPRRPRLHHRPRRRVKGPRSHRVCVPFNLKQG